MVAIVMGADCMGQRPVKLNNLWATPEVHVLFAGYKLSFTIKNMNRTLELMNQIGDNTWGTQTELDTLREYTIELYGSHPQYRNRLQTMMQHCIATFLLSAGQAEVRYKRRRLRTVLMDIQPIGPDGNTVRILFYDPKNNHMLYSGTMPVGMYKQDIGLY